jgi:hypothetical protein
MAQKESSSMNFGISPYLDNPANQSWRGAMLANRSQIVELELPPYTNATTLLGAQRRT